MFGWVEITHSSNQQCSHCFGLKAPVEESEKHQLGTDYRIRYRCYWQSWHTQAHVITFSYQVSDLPMSWVVLGISIKIILVAVFPISKSFKSNCNLFMDLYGPVTCCICNNLKEMEKKVPWMFSFWFSNWMKWVAVDYKTAQSLRRSVRWRFPSVGESVWVGGVCVEETPVCC